MAARRAGTTQKKYFTVETANKMLPLVRSIVGDIVEKFRDLDQLRERLELLRGSRRERLLDAHREEVEQIEREFADGKRSLFELIEELHQLGVEFKGTDGLVDFPALLDDRQVYLCWRLGESEVKYWHEVEAGFAGRQELTSEMCGDLSQP